MPLKEARFEARLSEEQNELLRWAAETRGTSLTSFVLEAALDRARALERDERITRIPADAGKEFLAWLDEPARLVPELSPLAEAPRLPER